nr:MAG TPA: hypothetical protein [Caudoviricetes sp.]
MQASRPWPDVGSSETELRRPTCSIVQVIIGPQRHCGITRQLRLSGLFLPI